MYGDITVTMKRAKDMDDWVIREFELVAVSESAATHKSIHYLLFLSSSHCKSHIILIVYFIIFN